MKNNFIFHVDALTEYKIASIWYEQQQTTLGLRFEKAVELTLKLIDENPYVFSFKKGLFREASVANFPYGIVYKFNEIKKRNLHICNLSS